MKTWILSIVGIVFVGVMLDIILPEGKTNSFIKHIFSVLMLFVIISPLTKIVGNGNGIFSSNTDVIDKNFIYETNLNKIDALEKDIENQLSKILIKNASVIISANIFEESLIIDNVYIDITNAEIDKSVKNVNDSILNIVKNIVNISDDKVCVYGK